VVQCALSQTAASPQRAAKPPRQRVRERLTRPDEHHRRIRRERTRRAAEAGGSAMPAHATFVGAHALDAVNAEWPAQILFLRDMSTSGMARSPVYAKRQP
jgi:hypothetical protein